MKIISGKSFQPQGQLALIVSRFNHSITEKLLSGALERIEELQFDSERCTIIWVPGAVEIGIVAQRLARSAKYQAIICLGAAICGETDHYRYVCQHVTENCRTLALQYDIPIIFSVLTTQTVAQAEDRVGGRKGHKGREAIDAAWDIMSVLEQLSID